MSKTLSDNRWQFLQLLQAADQQHDSRLINSLRTAANGSLAPPPLHRPWKDSDPLVRWARSWALVDRWCLTAFAWTLQAWTERESTRWKLQRPSSTLGGRDKDATADVAPIEEEHARWLAHWVVRPWSTRQIAAQPGIGSSRAAVDSGIQTAFERLRFSTIVQNRWTAEEALHAALEKQGHVLRAQLESAAPGEPVPVGGTKLLCIGRIDSDGAWHNAVFEQTSDPPLLARGDDLALVSEATWTTSQ